MIVRTILAVGALSLLGLASANAADTRRFECRATGASDISMNAKYEIRGTGTAARRKFSVEFEAAPDAGFREGQRIIVKVADVRVGAPTLEEIVGGDLVADLNLDTRPQADADPFPSNFPAGVGGGTDVQVLRGDRVVLGCTLRR